MPVVFLADAVNELVNGGVVGFPTETFWGLAANPFSTSAVEKLLDLKDRALDAGVPLIIDSPERVEEVIEEDPAVRAKRQALQKCFWPGPLTLVIAVKPDVLSRLARGIPGPAGSLAVRVSSKPLARKLAAGAGGFITATSANRKAEPPSTSRVEVRRYFPDLPLVDDEKIRLAHAGDKPERPSTLIDVRSYPFRIIRQGAIPESDLTQWLTPQ